MKKLVDSTYHDISPLLVGRLRVRDEPTLTSGVYGKRSITPSILIFRRRSIEGCARAITEGRFETQRPALVKMPLNELPESD